MFFAAQFEFIRPYLGVGSTAVCNNKRLNKNLLHS